MSGTNPARDVFAGQDSGGNPRRVDNSEVIAWAEGLEKRIAEIETPVAIGFHPMKGTHQVFAQNTFSHPWVVAYFRNPATDDTYLFYTQSHRHVQTFGEPLMLVRSIDKLQTSEEEYNIYSVEGYAITDAVGGVMSNGRIGLLVSLVDEQGNYRIDFIYTDDNWATRNVNTDVLPGSNIFPYGKMHAMLAAVSGLASDGFIVFGYNGGLQDAYTIDNGDNWHGTTGLEGGSSPVAVPTEPYVERLEGDDPRYIKFIRNGTGNMAFSKSTNLRTWSTPVVTDVLLGANPVHVIVHDGIVYIYLASRNNDSGYGNRNQFYVLKQPAEDLWTTGNLTVTEAEPVIIAGSQLLGYVQAFDDEGVFHWVFNANETEQGADYASGCSIVVGSSIDRVVASPAFVKSYFNNENLLRNPTFHWWDRGKIISVNGGTVKGPTGWVISGSGAVGTVERREIPPEISLLTSWRGRYGLGFNLSADNFISIYQKLARDPDDDGESMVRRYSDGIFTMTAVGWGAFPSSLYSQLSYMYGAGGTPGTVTRNLTIKSQTGNGLFWRISGTIRGAPFDGVSVGTDPEVKFAFGSSATGAFPGTLLGLKLERGDTATPLLPLDPGIERNLLNREVMRKSLIQYRTAAQGFQTLAGRAEFNIQFPEMDDDPVISMEGDPSDLRVLSVADGTIEPTSLLFSATRDGAVIDVRSSSFTTVGSNARLQQDTANTVTFVMDAGSL